MSSRLFRANIQSRTIFSKLATPNGRKSPLTLQSRGFCRPDKTVKLNVKNLPLSLTEADVRRHLSEKLGTTAGITVPKSFDGKILGTAEIQISATAAQAAISQLNQSEIQGEKIQVTKYIPLYEKLNEPTRLPTARPAQNAARYSFLNQLHQNQKPTGSRGGGANNDFADLDEGQENIDDSLFQEEEEPFDPSKPRDPKFYVDQKKKNHEAFDEEGSEIYPGAWDDTQVVSEEKLDPVPTSFNDEIGDWLARVKKMYNIDIFSQYYDDRDKEILTLSGLTEDADADAALKSLRTPSLSIDDDEGEGPYLGEHENFEQAYHDQTCANPPKAEVLKTLTQIAQSDWEKLVARDDFSLISFSSLPGNEGVEFQLKPTDKLVDEAYWVQYGYALSVYLTRLLAVSSTRLHVNALSQHGILTLTIIVFPRSKGDRVHNNEYDSELGPLAGVAPESEDYEKVRSKHKKKKAGLLVKKDKDYYVDLNILHENRLVDDPNDAESKRKVENQKLIRDYHARHNKFDRE